MLLDSSARCSFDVGQALAKLFLRRTQPHVLVVDVDREAHRARLVSERERLLELAPPDMLVDLIDANRRRSGLEEAIRALRDGAEATTEATIGIVRDKKDTTVKVTLDPVRRNPRWRPAH